MILCKYCEHYNDGLCSYDFDTDLLFNDCLCKCIDCYESGTVCCLAFDYNGIKFEKEDTNEVF